MSATTRKSSPFSDTDSQAPGASQTFDIPAHATEHSVSALKMVTTPNRFRPVAWFLTLLLLFIVLGLVFIPWQQSVVGIGRVIVFSPMDRPQSLQAQISARILKWHVVDGQQVKKNDPIVALAEVDPKFLDPNLLQRYEQQRQAFLAERAAATTQLQMLGQELQALTQSRNLAIPSAGQKNQQAQDRYRASEQALQAARQEQLTNELNLKRLRELYKEGLRSKRDLELAELAYVNTRTGVERAKVSLEVAARDTSIAGLDQEKVAVDTLAKLNSSQAYMAEAQQKIAKLTNELAKIEIEIQNIKQRIQQRVVLAPRSGRVVRLLKAGAGETVKSGDVLAVVAPDTADQAMEIYISDNDSPLVAVGRPVRLQIAGWPAIQFTGWPSIAVGTFAGRVAVIDAIDDGRGYYRVIVKPDTVAINAGKESPWPLPQYLRPGAEVTGWVMLDTVPIGYELWRQFNAFPPTIRREDLGLPEKNKSEAYPPSPIQYGAPSSKAKDEDKDSDSEWIKRTAGK